MPATENPLPPLTLKSLSREAVDLLHRLVKKKLCLQFVSTENFQSKKKIFFKEVPEYSNSTLGTIVEFEASMELIGNRFLLSDKIEENKFYVPQEIKKEFQEKQ